jgi:DNA-binding response OmpR family regulator
LSYNETNATLQWNYNYCMSLESVVDKYLEAPDAKGAFVPGINMHPPRRILLVDDDNDLRHLYAAVLSASGYQVDTAEDGMAGWKALRAESYIPDGYDLLITDNNMPNLSGIGLIKKMRSASLNLPVILASGNAPEDTESLQLAAILHKPFTGEELVQAVRKALQTTAHLN